MIFQVPTTSKEWMNIAKEYEVQWNVYNTICAMDGKHIRIKCPESSGSHYYNYKHFNSIILFALVDANYKFIYVDVGNAGIYAKSTIKHSLNNPSALNILQGTILPSTNCMLPYVVLTDDAFPLSHNVMKPYSQKNISKEERVFNYRLSRGRRVVKSTFEILATRFRVLLTSINLPPDTVKTIVLADCMLYNMLVTRRKHLYTRLKKNQKTCKEVNGCQVNEPVSHEELDHMEPIQQQLDCGHV